MNARTGRPPNITLRVMTRTEMPFVTFKTSKEGEVYEGNDRFEVRAGDASYAYYTLFFKLSIGKSPYYKLRKIYISF